MYYKQNIFALLDNKLLVADSIACGVPGNSY